jgi:hypothetical protein
VCEREREREREKDRERKTYRERGRGREGSRQTEIMHFIKIVRRQNLIKKIN